MATEQIPIGPIFSMVQNTIYALPAAPVLAFVTGTPTLQQSTDVAFGASKAVTLDTNNQAQLAGPFIRCTSAGPQLITLKRLS